MERTARQSDKSEMEGRETQCVLEYSDINKIRWNTRTRKTTWRDALSPCSRVYFIAGEPPQDSRTYFWKDVWTAAPPPLPRELLVPQGTSGNMAPIPGLNSSRYSFITSITSPSSFSSPPQESTASSKCQSCQSRPFNLRETSVLSSRRFPRGERWIFKLEPDRGLLYSGSL